MNYPLLAHKMPERIKKVWRWTWLVETVITLLLGGVAFLIYHFIWHNQWLFYGLLVYLSVVIVKAIVDLALIPYRYTFHRYELASEDLAFQEGFIFRSTTYVPLNRIQHIETEQGPFLRHENLVELVIHTAATKHKILGLDVNEAQQLRAQIIEMVRQAKEDV